MALRSHWMPKMASSAPTNRRSTLSGIKVSAGPTAATTTASTTRASAMPWKVERHSRVRPAASTMVSASIASTAQATQTVRMRGSAVIRLLRSELLECSGDGEDRRKRLAGAHLPGAARADQAALYGVAPDQEPGRHLPAELGRRAAGQHGHRAGAAQAAAGDHRDVGDGGAAVLLGAGGRARRAQR